jgi:Mg2+-importing ATPase
MTAGGYRRLSILPFDHERQLASVLVKDPDGRPFLITKGAPEVVMDRCVNVPGGARPTLEALFSEGARLVAVATRSAEGVAALAAGDEKGLALAGFLAS